MTAAGHLRRAFRDREATAVVLYGKGRVIRAKSSCSSAEAAGMARYIAQPFLPNSVEGKLYFRWQAAFTAEN